MRPLILLPTFLSYPLALALVAPRHFNPTQPSHHSDCRTKTVATTTTTTMTTTLTMPSFPTAFPSNSSSGFLNATTTGTGIGTGISISTSTSSPNTLEPITLITLPSDAVDSTPAGTVGPGAAPTPNDIPPVTLIDVDAAPTI
ncbi:hypothetical protein DDE82_006488 [Stemphylium lycopersici]|nr:hypothetical protein DDE82_006488 [Stemphylium lycopersici]